MRTVIKYYVVHRHTVVCTIKSKTIIVITDRATLEKQQRLQEVLRGINQLFKRLNVCWRTVSEGTSGMDPAEVEALIPYRDQHQGGTDLRAELEKKRGEWAK